MSTTGFTSETFQFLHELKDNNDRDWFQAHKQRYFKVARDPMLTFIQRLQGLLHSLSPHLRVDPRPTGGSMFRIYRDIRFSADKSPYKTHLAARFPHRDGKKGAAPGFYISLHADGGYAAAGLWRPETKVARLVRKAIVADPARWSAVTLEAPVEGERLKRPPLGFPSDHHLIEDLKLKEFVTSKKLTQKQICRTDFPLEYFKISRQKAPLMHFLCDALQLPW